MSQVYQTIQKPKPEKIEESFNTLQQWNKPIGEERSVDVEWTDPLTGKGWKVRLPYWVKFAIDVEYVFPGYSLQDYMHGAINGFPSDAKDIKKAGFNLVAICNEMGQFKSNLALQLSGQVYGEEKAGEWYPDWDTVLKHKILSREEIIPTWKQAKEMGGRIKLQLLDDIDSIFSKELWFEDRNLYIKLRKALNLIRPRLSNFIVTAPSLNDVISILNTKITFEVMPFPNKTYMVERYCRFVDQFSSTTNFFRKIMTEYSKFKAKDLPSTVYKQYDEARALKEEEEMGELEKAMEDSVKKGEQEEAKQEAKNPWMQPRDPKAISQVKILICEKCGYQWPSDKNPMMCPKCHTRKIMSKIFNLVPEQPINK